MRLERVYLCNFRCFQQETSVNFCDLTAFVGKNDIGKSTILEALEIFFNNDTIKIDRNDRCIYSKNDIASITCEFSDFPASLTLDAGATTDLASEYLLTPQGTLKIKQTFDCSKSKITPEVFILANHPTAKGVESLLEIKEKELQALVKSKNLQVALKGNPGMRKALWNAEDALQLKEIELSVTKEDSKKIWEQIEKYLPMYALFQSDRKSKDSDSEVQDPMKAAVTAALAEVQSEIDEIQLRIREKAEAIAKETHKALFELDTELAQELKPEFTPPTTAKWNGLFSINMLTDGIPLNKRGSGVRRLVLVSFFRAEAQRKLEKSTSTKRSIIYAIEEPETSQHPNNQRILIDALKSLSAEAARQVIITTHSPGLASELPADCIRFVTRNGQQPIAVQEGVSVFGEIAKTLGVIPDNNVKVLFCVEGPTDVRAFKCLSHALHTSDPTIPDLSTDDRVAFVVLGGGTLSHWVAENYLKGLGRAEFHIYDRDVPAYEISVASVNGRNDGSYAVLTAKHEIECYLHPDAIRDAFGVNIAVADHPADANSSVGKLFAHAYSMAQGFDGIMGEDKAKRKLAERAFPKMTAERIDERDPNGEVRGWFRQLNTMLEATRQLSS